MIYKLYGLIGFFYFSNMFNAAFALEPKDILRLKQNNIGDTVIEAVEKEKIIETCALTIDDIILLKKSGYSDQNISDYIYSRSFLKNREDRTYQNFRESAKITELDIQDLEYLKSIGFNDDLIKTIIMNQHTPDADEEVHKALIMFENMGLILNDARNMNERHKSANPH